MTETLTGKQVLALLAQDEVPKIECFVDRAWVAFNEAAWSVTSLRLSSMQFRIKPTPPRRLSVTLANGEVVSWPEPVREALEYGKQHWIVTSLGVVDYWDGYSADALLAFGNVHLTREAAQEHADALKKINTQGVVCA